MSDRTFPAWAWTPLVFVVDFLTKRIVLAHEPALRAKIEVIGDLARFIYVRNPGSAMGLFPVGRTVLVAVSILASLFLVYLYFTTDRRLTVRRAAMASILGGALGNLVDRLFYGGLVVDFIDLGIGTHRFYTFNVADMGVTIGGALLFLSLLKESLAGDPRPGPESAAESAAEPAGGESGRTGSDAGDAPRESRDETV